MFRFINLAHMAALFLLLCFISCNREKKHFEFEILVDLTASSSNTIDIKRTIEFIRTKTGIHPNIVTNNSATIHITPINEIRNNIYETVTLSSGNRMQDVVKERKKKQLDFLQQLETLLNKINITESGLNSSMVYVPFCRKLKRISESKATNKFVLVFSDLMHNTRDRKSSFYNTSTDKLKEIIINDCQVGNLQDVSIYFIYQPIDVVTDDDYEKAKEIWSSVLKHKSENIDLYFQSSLNSL